MRRDVFQAIADPTRRAIIGLIALQAMNEQINCFEARRQFEKVIDQIYILATRARITSWNHTPGTSATVVLKHSIMALTFTGTHIEVQICEAKNYKPNTPPVLAYKLESESYSYIWLLCNPETGNEHHPTFGHR